MGGDRAWKFNAVIGVGGKGGEARMNGIDRKLNWVGIGADRFYDNTGRLLVRFRHFKHWGDQGALLKDLTPNLAQYIYEGGVRVMMHSSASSRPRDMDLRKEVQDILALAGNATPSITARRWLAVSSGTAGRRCHANHPPMRSKRVARGSDC